MARTRMLARLAAMEKSVMDTKFCFLTETFSLNDLGEPTKTGYSATIIQAQVWEHTRLPKVDDPDKAQKIADWKVSGPVGTVANVEMIGLQGVAVWRGTYNVGTAYAVGDGVIVGEKFYVSVQAGTGHLVTDAAYWKAAPRFEIMGTNEAASNKSAFMADLKLVAS